MPPPKRTPSPPAPVAAAKKGKKEPQTSPQKVVYYVVGGLLVLAVLLGLTTPTTPSRKGGRGGNLDNGNDDFQVKDVDAEDYEEQGPTNITKVTASTWSGVVGDRSKHVLVLFYADWCENTKKMLPNFEEMAGELQALIEPAKDAVRVAKINCPANVQLCRDELKVQGFPTFRLFPKNDKRPFGTPEFEGNYFEKQHFYRFLNRETGERLVPDAIEADNLNTNLTILARGNFSAVVNDTKKDVLVEFFAPWCSVCKSIAPTLEEMAVAAKRDQVPDFVFGRVDATEYRFLAQSYGVNSYPTIIAFPKGGAGNKQGSRLDGNDRSWDGIARFANEKFGRKIFGPEPTAVPYLTADNFDEVTLRSGKHVLVEFFAPWCGACKQFKPAYEELGQRAENTDLVVTKVDAIAEESLAQRFGVESYPTILYFGPGGPAEGEKYEGPRSLGALVAHVNKRAGRTVLTTGQSISIEAGKVTVLNGDTLNELVTAGTHDVLVKFYAPWCGACKAYAPAHEELAQAASGDTELVIADLDADQHRDAQQQHGIQTLPTIKLFLRGQEQPVTYSGQRNPQSLLQFIATARNQGKTTGRDTTATVNE
eukprot:TRINITY_DN2236_c0_g1_i2.p1 TRINITY_DN2236_c0_g1~~TRINITY_DN2236_c0_g1_i2.p1  ORF type:complete len:594 (+),score=145.22 TRINITY_DN2236_c0_g1_i2:242-2023(+)